MKGCCHTDSPSVHKGYSQRKSELRWMVLNAQDVGLEEGISSGMRERIVELESATKQSEWEIKVGGGDEVTFERYCRWWCKFLRGS